MNANRIKVPALEVDIQFTYRSRAAARPHASSIMMFMKIAVLSQLPHSCQNEPLVINSEEGPVSMCCFMFKVFMGQY